MATNCRHSLAGRTEGNSVSHFLMLSDIDVVGFIPGVDKLQKSTLSFISNLLKASSLDFWIGVGVECDSVIEKLFVLLVELIITGVETVEKSPLAPELSDLHKVFSESARFVRAYVIGTSHCFTGLKEPNQVVFIFHLRKLHFKRLV